MMLSARAQPKTTRTDVNNVLSRVQNLLSSVAPTTSDVLASKINTLATETMASKINTLTTETKASTKLTTKNLNILRAKAKIAGLSKKPVNDEADRLQRLSEISDLRKQISAAEKQRDAEVTRLQKEVQAAKAQVFDAERIAEELKALRTADAEANSQRISELERQLKVTERNAARSAELESKLIKTQTELSKKHTELVALEKQHLITERRLVGRVSSAEARTQQERERADALQADYQAQLAQVEELRTKLLQSDQDLVQSEKDLVQANEDLLEAQDAYDKAMDRLTEIEDALFAEQQMRFTLQRQLDEAEADVMRLDGMKDQLLAQLEESEAESTTFALQIDELEQEIAQKNKTIKNLHKAARKANRYKSKNQELELAIRAKAAEVEELERTAELYIDQNEQLYEQQRQLSAENEKLVDKISRRS